MAFHNELGQDGEAIAVDYLRTNGYEILDRNWRFLKAEIDIVAKYNNVLVVVEVKTRTSSYFGDPEHFVSTKKMKLLIEASNAYVLKKDLDLEVRFDIVGIIKNKNVVEIRHLENAFTIF